MSSDIEGPFLRQAVRRRYRKDWLRRFRSLFPVPVSAEALVLDVGSRKLPDPFGKFLAMAIFYMCIVTSSRTGSFGDVDVDALIAT